MPLPDYLTALVKGDTVWHPRLGEGIVVAVPGSGEGDEFQIVFVNDSPQRVRSIRAVMAGLEPIALNPARAEVYQARLRLEAGLAARARAVLDALRPPGAVFTRRYWRHELPREFAWAGPGAYLWLVEVFLEDGAHMSGWGGSEVAAIESVAGRAAVSSVLTALSEAGHYVFEADRACDSRPCGIVITFPNDSLIGATAPVVLAVRTPFDEAESTGVGGDAELLDRFHADEHLRGFPAFEYRFGRVLVETSNARDAVEKALLRLPPLVARGGDEGADAYGDDLDGLPF